MPANWAVNLLKLQESDLRLRDLETRLGSIPQEIQNLKNRRDAAVGAAGAAAEHARSFERAAKAAEAEITRLEAESAKLKQQTAMVKKNNEYQAMLTTIALNAKKISDLESTVLENLDKFESAKADYRKIRAENEAVVRGISDEFNELVEFSSEVKVEIAKLKEARPELARPIERDLESHYNMLLRGKNPTPPLVPVENGICGSCHLRVTPQGIASINRGAVTYCDNCQHIIFLPEFDA